MSRLEFDRDSCARFLGTGLITALGATVAAIIAPDAAHHLGSLGVMVGARLSEKLYEGLANGAVTGGSLAATGIIAEWQLRAHERGNDKIAERNHLIRRAMALALSQALQSVAQDEEIIKLIPEPLHETFFTHWPNLLKEAHDSKQSTLIDLYFSLQASEEQWQINNSYFDSPSDAGFDTQPLAQQRRLSELEDQMARALASLLTNLPLQQEQSAFITIFSGSPQKLPPDGVPVAFAAKILPVYRVRFAIICSKGGPITAAIFLKQNKEFTKSLAELGISLDSYFTVVLETVKEEGTASRKGHEETQRKLDRLEKMFEDRLEKMFEDRLEKMAEQLLASKSDGNSLKNAAVLPLDPATVVEQISKSDSPIATKTVEDLLAAGNLAEAQAVASVQFQIAEKAKKAGDQAFAKACFDMGGINEISSQWTMALQNYRQAWELSGYKNPDYGLFFGSMAAQVNRHTEAIVVLKCVLEISDTDVLRARTQGNLGNAYAATLQYSEAEEAFRDAHKLFSTLEDQSPTTLRQITANQHNLANLLDRTGRTKEAENLLREAIETSRQFAVSNPKFAGECAVSLIALSSHYIEHNRYAEAEPFLDEAVSFCSRPKDECSDESSHTRGMALINLSIVYRQTGRSAKARATIDEALSIFSGLAKTNPDAYLNLVANALGVLASQCADEKDLTKQEESLTKALQIWRTLVHSDSQTFIPELSNALGNLANFYSEQDRTEEADRTFDELLKLRSGLVESSRSAFLPDLATALTNYGNYLAKNLRIAEADETYKAALGYFRELVDANPELYDESLAWSLHNAANFYSKNGFSKEADVAYDQALSIYRKFLGAC